MSITLQVGVKALLKNKEGKYLLIQRSVEKYPEVGAKWDIVGGRIDPGVTLFENLKREVKEETQLDLLDEPRLVAAQDIVKVEGKHIVRLTYVGTIDGEPVLDDEHTAYQWVTIDEMRIVDPLDSYVKELLERGILE